MNSNLVVTLYVGPACSESQRLESGGSKNLHVYMGKEWDLSLDPALFKSWVQNLHEASWRLYIGVWRPLPSPGLMSPTAQSLPQPRGQELCAEKLTFLALCKLQPCHPMSAFYLKFCWSKMSTQPWHLPLQYWRGLLTTVGESSGLPMCAKPSPYLCAQSLRA